MSRDTGRSAATPRARRRTAARRATAVMVVSSALLAVSPLGSIVAVAEDPPTTSAAAPTTPASDRPPPPRPTDPAPGSTDTAPGSSDAATTTGPSSSTTNPQGPSVDTVDPTTDHDAWRPDHDLEHAAASRSPPSSRRPTRSTPPTASPCWPATTASCGRLDGRRGGRRRRPPLRPVQGDPDAGGRSSTRPPSACWSAARVGLGGSTGRLTVGADADLLVGKLGAAQHGPVDAWRGRACPPAPTSTPIPRSAPPGRRTRRRRRLAGHVRRGAFHGVFADLAARGRTLAKLSPTLDADGGRRRHRSPAPACPATTCTWRQATATVRASGRSAPPTSAEVGSITIDPAPTRPAPAA